jgi:phosphoribosylaminoimidazolecarboxamide formyltransferase/IMP cyclohydrolase
MLDGRVKTLHPKIHAGILAVRGNAKHMADIKRAGIKPIDLVIVNLYTVRADRGDAGDRIRRDPGDDRCGRSHHGARRGQELPPRRRSSSIRWIIRALEEIRRTGALSEAFRFELAKKAFRHVAAYDTAICA